MQRKIKIVCLGDSITGPGDGKAYLDKYVKWSDLLQFGLGASLGFNRVEVLNRGVAGDTSSGVLRHLDERLLQAQPDIVVILIGTNNFDKNADKAEASRTFKTDLTDIVAQAKTAGIKVLLLQYPTPRAENMEKVWVHGDAGNPVIEEVARETGCPVLNLKGAFDTAAQTLSLACLASPVDGIHLSPGGELVLAKAVLEKLVSLGWTAAEPDAGKAAAFAFTTTERF